MTDDDKRYVTALKDDDVLLGRGQPILNYPGNLRFRKIIKEHKEEYSATGKHATKDDIARSVLSKIKETGARFLRKIEENERDALKIPEEVFHAWLIVDEVASLQKVKQALREQPNSKKRVSDAANSKNKKSRKGASLASPGLHRVTSDPSNFSTFGSDLALLGRSHSNSLGELEGGSGSGMSATEMDLLMQLRRSQGLQQDPVSQRQRLLAMLQQEQAMQQEHALQQSVAARLPPPSNDLNSMWRALAARNGGYMQSSLASSVNFGNMAADASLLTNRVQQSSAPLDTATLQFLHNREQQASQRLFMLQQRLQQQSRDAPTNSPKATKDD